MDFPFIPIGKTPENKYLFIFLLTLPKKKIISFFYAYYNWERTKGWRNYTLNPKSNIKRSSVNYHDERIFMNKSIPLKIKAVFGLLTLMVLLPFATMAQTTGSTTGSSTSGTSITTPDNTSGSTNSTGNNSTSATSSTGTTNDNGTTSGTTGGTTGSVNGSNTTATTPQGGVNAGMGGAPLATTGLLALAALGLGAAGLFAAKKMQHKV
jgi:hypothetical protein